ncbi:acid protease [Macrolepiota fuliginosa MF-IS2]|uniref:Acid protease n=1 Tax=Macrolepiota fuliginosa MF-IS2 TaxID=1400762 RepID=A0A9P5X285_9AGAR|nr:acid protease [Macrolepiota fuliginosa MF-IS2]
MGKLQQTCLTLAALVALEPTITAYASPQAQPVPQPYPNLNNSPKKRVAVRSGTTSMPLQRRASSPRTKEEWGEWAYEHRQGLAHKYGEHGKEGKDKKRSTGTNLLVNQGGDSGYYGSLAIGTPGTSFNLILDTGSADLWVADSQCTTGCISIPTFQSSSSSTFQNLSKPFQITYGSGQAQGSLVQDMIQMAGFSVPNQIFATANAVSSGLLQSPVSGLLGLAFGTIAASKAMPFWQTLASSGVWDEPVMAFHLTRFNNATDSQRLEPGGSFDMGFTNPGLYTGEIDYVDLPSRGTYWILPLTTLRVNEHSVGLLSGSSSWAAIDTGTTLVGGPREAIADVFGAIPGSQRGTGNFEGYYTYPCDHDVTIQLGFGDSKRMWPISPSDFRLVDMGSGECLGAFFELSGGGSAPPWIIGDTFLKNVYSIFRYQPPSVGFADLSTTVLQQNGVSGPLPSATVASVVATVSASVTAVPPNAATAFKSKDELKRITDIAWLAAAFVGLMV